jgi:hypothetical protein
VTCPRRFRIAAVLAATVFSIVNTGTAQAQPRFDVAYVSDYTFSRVTGAGIGTMALIVNTGTVTLDLSQLAVLSVSDDHPQAELLLVIEQPSAKLLTPGTAAGGLSQAAAEKILWTGLVTEPVVDVNPQLSLGVSNVPFGETGVIHGEIKVGIGLAIATLPVEIHYNNNVPAHIFFDSAKRISSEPTATEQQADVLRTEIKALLQVGSLTATDSDTLLRLLDTSLSRIYGGRTLAGLNTLTAVKNRANALFVSGKLASTERDALVAAVEAIQTQLVAAAQ